MSAYVTNLCTNPSFEASLSGWSALGGTAISQDATYVEYGSQAMMVVTDGASGSEGFYSGAVPVSGSPATCSVSISLLGPGGGTVALLAVSGTTGTVLGSATLALTGTWQRVQVSGFTVQPGDSFEIMIQTQSPQALTFWADAAQQETGVTSASIYIDGDQPGCSWLGTPELSASSLPFQNTTSASGLLLMSGYALPAVVGEDFYTSASGLLDMTGDAAPAAGNPIAAFNDFAIFELTDPDPAQTYVDQNNAATNSGHTTWASNYGLFYPPLDYPVSGGNLLWKRAAYMAMGMRFTSVGSSQEQLISDAMVSLSPVTGSAPVPATYTSPRQIETIIKPTRLNFITNPSFEVSTSGWSGVATGTIAQDTTTATPTPGWLTVAQAGSLSTYFNGVAISNDGSTGTGNFDGNGYSFSAQALAATGFIPGGEVTANGITYMIPNAGPGAEDNVQAVGQVIPVPGPVGATVLGFLGASSGGGISGVTGTVTITYTDGTNDSGSLQFTDWTEDDGASGTLSGNQVAAAIAYQNKQDGTTNAVNSYLFTQIVQVNPAKAVASITLPNAPGLHIFAVSLAEPDGFLSGTASGKVTVNANADGASISIPDLIVGDTYVVTAYVQAGAGLANILASCSGSSVAISDITTGIPYGGEPGIGYGQGPYGGIGGDEPPYSDGTYGSGLYGGASNDIPTGIWIRGAFTFVAQASTETLSFTADGGADVSYPTNFWIDGVMVEAGTEVQPYFDGSYGASDYLDYQWEGTAGLSRSYYYQQLAVKKHTITQTLAKHTPIGLTYAAPSYLTPYSQ